MKSFMIVKVCILATILLSVPVLASQQPVTQPRKQAVDDLIEQLIDTPPYPNCIIWILRQLRRVAFLFVFAMTSFISAVYLFLKNIRNDSVAPI